MEDLPLRIKALISALGLNNAQFAEKLDVAASTIDGYTNGRKKGGEIKLYKPNLDILKRMIEVFNVNPYYIVGLNDEMFRLNFEFNNNNDLINYIIQEDFELSKSVIYMEYIKNKKLDIEATNLEEKYKSELADLLDTLNEKLRKKL